MNIYVGNIPYTATEEDLRQTFEEFGTVTSTSIILDKETGRSRGFGFVEMANNEEGTRAIEEMNGKDWMGRSLTVNEARPRAERPAGSGGGGGYGRREYSGGGGGGYGRREYSGGGGGGDYNRSSGGGGGDYNRSSGGGSDYDRRRSSGGGGGSRDRSGRGNDYDNDSKYNRWERGGDDDE